MAISIELIRPTATINLIRFYPQCSQEQLYRLKVKRLTALLDYATPAEVPEIEERIRTNLTYLPTKSGIYE